TWLSAYTGVVTRPTIRGAGIALPCPCPGSLDSLITRHAAFARRFQPLGSERARTLLFAQPPMPRFAQVAYGSPPWRRLYALRDPLDDGSFRRWCLAAATPLVEALRAAAVARLNASLPERVGDIERFIVGRKPDGSD